MTGMRRRVSTLDVRSPTSPAADAAEAKKVKAVAVAPPELAEVNCGVCTVSFTSGRLARYGVASLTVKLDGQRTASGLLASLRHSLSAVCSVIDVVLGLGVEFVVTYDCRKCASLGIAEGLAKFLGLRRDSLARFAKSAAVLVEENIFGAVSSGLINSLGEAFFPVCPFLMCHGEAAAEDFFLLKAGASLDPPRLQPRSFVSMVSVSAALKTQASGACVAAMAPLEAAAGEEGPLCDKQRSVSNIPEVTPTYHVLPNGDVRVIQSAPCDVILPGCEHAKALEPGDVQSITALRFRGPLDDLQRLVGLHFHVGEIIVDADCWSREAASRRGDARWWFLRGATEGCQCTAGLTSLLKTFGDYAVKALESTTQIHAV